MVKLLMTNLNLFYIYLPKFILYIFAKIFLIRQTIGKIYRTAENSAYDIYQPREKLIWWVLRMKYLSQCAIDINKYMYEGAIIRVRSIGEMLCEFSVAAELHQR